MSPIVHHGDCLDVLREMPDNSVHAVITDPPYGLANTTPEQVADTIVRWVNGERDYLPAGKGFMGKAWDGFVPPVAVWDEAMRVLKPGGHVLAFAGTRTMDLMTLGLRLAGFDIRESVLWVYGSGFPKSHNVSKAIDKAAGAEREIVGSVKQHTGNGSFMRRSSQAGHGYRPSGEEFGGLASGEIAITAPATDAAKQWEGWGTALKPATEPIVMARKPFRGTVAANVLQHGTGAINVNATRIGGESGRWPANVILDEEMAGVLDQQSGTTKSSSHTRHNTAEAHNKTASMHSSASDWNTSGPQDEGGASRFFHVIEQDAPFIYCAKAPKKERPQVEGVAHSTVKPLRLMRMLVRMVTPPGGTILEPFAGSGTTIEAAMLEGFNIIGIEREAEYLPLIHERIRRATEQLNTRTEGPEQGSFSFEETA